MATPINIELIMDVICPWCYLGHAHLKKAIEARQDQYEFNISIKPFLLYDNIPLGGVAKGDFKGNRRPGMGRILLQEARDIGIEIDYKKIERIPNSLAAHRLLCLVSDKQKQHKLSELLFESYFAQGGDVEGKEALLALAQKAEIDPKSIQAFAETTEGQEEVQQLIEGYKAAGITAVPAFRFNGGEHHIQGVQQREAFIRYFDRMQKRG